MAGIIKADGQRSNYGATGQSEFNLQDVSQRAQQYVAGVKKQAEQLLTIAERDAEQLRQKARDEGAQQARQAAQKDVQQWVDHRLAPIVPALQQAARQIEQARSEWTANWEHNLIKLSVAIAERIIRRELAEQPDIAQDWIREALQLATRSGRLQLHLNPEDRESLGDGVNQLTQALEGVGPVVVIEDESVSLGGCRVTSEFGEIDLQLETQLQRIEDELAR